MNLPHGFRRLRLAEEHPAKTALINTEQRRLLSGHLFKSPGARSERVIFHLFRSRCACSANSNSWRKEATAEQKLTEGSFWTRQRPRGISFGVVAERRLFRAQGYRTMDSGINSSTPARCIF